MPALPTWKIVARGRVPLRGPRVTEIDYECNYCGRSALLPILGRPLAQLSGGGIVFDTDGPHAVPRLIACRACRHSFESADGMDNVR